MKKSIWLLGIALCHVFGVFETSLRVELPPAAATDCEHAGYNFSSGLIPQHSIVYQDDRAPKWKKNWDLAREFFQLNKYDQALAEYEQLLRRKNNVSQARLEYIILLMRSKQWAKARRELAVLIAQEPERPEHQFVQAEIVSGIGELNNAERLYAQLYQQQKDKNCCEVDLAEILSGYISILERLKKTDALLSFMEELITLRPQDYALQKKTASVAMRAGMHQKAVYILLNLRKSLPEDKEVVEELSRIYNKLGKKGETFKGWRQIVTPDKESLEYKKKSSVYMKRLSGFAVHIS
ncbi:MAG: hypothetical protein D3924_15810 [Candidatus Electrothrix sp. AR4]|nr:hypothetical protein [Candidatus Electrothrix sp. AR4]